MSDDEAVEAMIAEGWPESFAEDAIDKRQCDICGKPGSCCLTDDPVLENLDDEWWCLRCWCKRIVKGKKMEVGDE
jgi:hypothetical protein